MVSQKGHLRRCEAASPLWRTWASASLLRFRAPCMQGRPAGRPCNRNHRSASFLRDHPFWKAGKPLGGKQNLFSIGPPGQYLQPQLINSRQGNLEMTSGSPSVMTVISSIRAPSTPSPSYVSSAITIPSCSSTGWSMLYNR